MDPTDHDAKVRPLSGEVRRHRETDKGDDMDENHDNLRDDQRSQTQHHPSSGKHRVYGEYACFYQH